MSFGLVKHNNNSLSAITSFDQLSQGSMTLLQTQTASSSASISFTSNIDSTYPIYIFKFINIHAQTVNSEFTFNLSIDAGSNYNVTKTTSFFRQSQDESSGNEAFVYVTSHDLAQSTSFQNLFVDQRVDSDSSGSGEIILFSPSSTTFVKHFLISLNYMQSAPASNRFFIGGYANTTSAVDAVQFKMSSGNIDSGTIKLYGIKGS